MCLASRNTLNRVGIRNSTDYSPFGVELDGRTVSLEGYRFGYQGSENQTYTPPHSPFYHPIQRQKGCNLLSF